MKKCSECQKTLPLTEFYSSKKTKDKLINKCKVCILKYQKVYRDKRKDEINKKKRDFYATNSNRIKAEKTVYRQANKERISIYNKNYYNENKKIISLKAAEKYRNNKLA
jgi:hypothetical protein